MQLIEQTIGELSESPFWHPLEQALYWCDINGRQICRCDLTPGEAVVQRWPMPSEPGCIAPARAGGLIVAMREGVFSFDPLRRGAEPVMLIASPYDSARYRFNDGRCDPAGRLLAGTLNEAKSASDAALYSIFQQGSQWQCRQLLGGVMTANGLAFSPDGRRLYWADTPAHRIDILDYDPTTGAASNRRLFASFERRPADGSLAGYEGRPDGAAVDAEGCYWVAMYEGAQVLRISPEGKILERLRVPVQCPTMVCLGGPALRTLFVTSARAGRPDTELAAQPGAGGVFRTDVPVPGLPVAFFG